MLEDGVCLEKVIRSLKTVIFFLSLHRNGLIPAELNCRHASLYFVYWLLIFIYLSERQRDKGDQGGRGKSKRGILWFIPQISAMVRTEARPELGVGHPRQLSCVSLRIPTLRHPLLPPGVHISRKPGLLAWHQALSCGMQMPGYALLNCSSQILRGLSWMWAGG